MPVSYCETWRWVCDDLGSNILVFCWSYNTLNGRITASDCVDILGNHVHLTIQMLFPNNDAAFQDDYSPIHTASIVQSSIPRRIQAVLQANGVSTPY